MNTSRCAYIATRRREPEPNCSAVRAQFGSGTLSFVRFGSEGPDLDPLLRPITPIERRMLDAELRLAALLARLPIGFEAASVNQGAKGVRPPPPPAAQLTPAPVLPQAAKDGPFSGTLGGQS